MELSQGEAFYGCEYPSASLTLRQLAEGYFDFAVFTDSAAARFLPAILRQFL